VYSETMSSVFNPSVLKMNTTISMNPFEERNIYPVKNIGLKMIITFEN
jgi:hypothetical protein